MNFDADSSQQTWKLWGEEKEEDSVYTIYLKKVRYQNPTKTIVLESDDERSHLEWETIRVKFIKAGTIEKLVKSLSTDDGELESTFVNIFLATFRTFATPQQVLSLLIERYDYLVNNKENLSESIIDSHKKTVKSALHVWLDSYPEDFREPPFFTCLRCLHSFALTYLPKTELNIKVSYKLEKFLSDCKKLDVTTFVSDSYDLVITSPQHSLYDFPNIAEKHFAEQLTRMDRDVLKKMVAHQCLGAVWSKNKRAGSAPTVLATIDQFNAVSLRVISTVLLAINSDRSLVVETWIDIAQELRVLKNFSSLKAIISGLQSNSIFRLKKTWHSISKDKMELFQELARIFSQENNQWAQRKLLIREGTAKFANTFEHNDRHLQKIIQKQSAITKLNIGTIPYLGTFLTDLTMIDTANPDILHDGLINFDKKRKEFEVLAQIKLLQGAANSYNIPIDTVFDQWFYSILVLDDREAFRISCQIEPLDNIALSCTNSTIGGGKKQNYEHKKNNSISSNCSSRSFFGFSNDGLHSANNSLDKQDLLHDLSSSSSNFSLQSFDLSLNGSQNTNDKSCVNNSTFNTSSDFYIIRITIDDISLDTEGVILYKSIILSNNERTPQVIRNAMLKFCIDDDPENYTLSQILPDKEMVLPMTANVYYAVNTEYDLNFLLRKKSSKNNVIPKK